MQIGRKKRGANMDLENNDGCKCPRCDDHIPEQFYCRNCGYVPNWRQKPHEQDESYKVAA
jgi:anaerobic ribonucleoside-triphosphate reductase